MSGPPKLSASRDIEGSDFRLSANYYCAALIQNSKRGPLDSVFDARSAFAGLGVDNN
jgi:hypothetical protein